MEKELPPKVCISDFCQVESKQYIRNPKHIYKKFISLGWEKKKKKDILQKVFMLAETKIVHFNPPPFFFPQASSDIIRQRSTTI